MKGYILHLKIKYHDRDTYLYADEAKNVRSIIDREGLQYFSEEERWSDKNIWGTLEGIAEKDFDIQVVKEGRTITWQGNVLIGKIIGIKEVDIQGEIKRDPGIVGSTRPAYKPYALN